VEFSQRDNQLSGKTIYAQVRGEQDNGEILGVAYVDHLRRKLGRAKLERVMSVRLTLVFLCAISIPIRAEIGIRVILGITDKEPARWDGSASVDRGRITKIDPWRFSKEDEILGKNSWKASTRQLTVRTATEARPVVSNEIILWLSGEDESTEIHLKTVQRDFSLRLSDLPYGKFGHALDGRVAVDRIPPSLQVTGSRDEQDYPVAALAPNGDIWLAYLESPQPGSRQTARSLECRAQRFLRIYSASGRGPGAGEAVLAESLERSDCHNGSRRRLVQAVDRGGRIGTAVDILVGE